MKKFTLSIAAVMAMSTFAIAGGDIAPVEEPMVEVVAPVVTDSGFYLGLGYSFMQDERVWTEPRFVGQKTESDWNAVMLQAGYKFNQYIAVEGRYWLTVGDPDFTWNDGDDYYYEESELDAWGIYVKPMYPVTDAFDVYALLGYAQSKLSAYDDDYVAVDDGAFSWGLGAAYSFTDNLSVFVDYVVLYDDGVIPTSRGASSPDRAADIKIDTWNFGVTYKF